MRSAIAFITSVLLFAGCSSNTDMDETVEGGAQDPAAAQTPQADNPAVQQVSGNVVQNLMDKLGLNQQQAGSVANGLVPDVLKNLVNKTNDPNDNDFNLQDVLKGVAGNSGINAGDLLGKDGAGDLTGMLGKMFK